MLSARDEVRASRILLTVLIASPVALWFASEWWEKHYATLKHIEVSPSTCYRVEQYEPYWFLPALLHREVSRVQGPNEPEYHWFSWWQVPAFYRLVDQRSGKVLGTSEVFDAAREQLGIGAGIVDWGSAGNPDVYVGNFRIGAGNDPACAAADHSRSESKRDATQRNLQALAGRSQLTGKEACLKTHLEYQKAWYEYLDRLPTSSFPPLQPPPLPTCNPRSSGPRGPHFEMDPVPDIPSPALE